MAEKLWGGRFKKKIDKDFENFSKSIHFDCRLAEYDILHSLIHITALKKTGLLTEGEFSKLSKALIEILKEVRRGKFKVSLESEDIHSEIHNRVKAKSGKIYQKLHSLRSRNDQIVFDEKLYCVDGSSSIIRFLKELANSITILARLYRNTIFIGYTHTRRAQVILFSHYICAYREMILQDIKRLLNFRRNLEISIGSGALAGSGINKNCYKEALREVMSKYFESKTKLRKLVNPLYNVSDRDFIVEFLSIISLIQMHLSRLAEDFIVYSTKEFDFLDLPEEFCTGSSLMPHKKNPDFLELVRGNTGKIYGNLISVLIMLKAQPLSYNRDMQCDKEPLFLSVEIIKEELKIMAKFIKKVRLKEKNINTALQDESLYSTELAEYLVIKDGLPFKEAHNIVGGLIRYSQDKKIKIRNMSDELLQTFHRSLTQRKIRKVMTPTFAINSKKSFSRGTLRPER